MRDMDPVSFFQERDTGLEYTDVGFNTHQDDVIQRMCFQPGVEEVNAAAIKIKLFNGVIYG